MKNNKLISIKMIAKIMTAVLFTAMLCMSSVFAESINENAGTKNFLFLKMGLGARVMAMGGAFTAVADDVNAIRYNPAGLRTLLRKQVMGTHIAWFQGIRGEYVAYGQPLKSSMAIGASLLLFTADEIERRDDAGNMSGYVGFEQGVAHLAWATRLDRNERVLFGIGVKYVYEILDGDKWDTASCDVGILGRVAGSLFLGAAYRNIDVMNANLPEEIRAGLSYFFPKTTISVDAIEFSDTGLRIAIGGEYIIKRTVAFRLGYGATNNEALGELENDTFKDLGLARTAGMSTGLGFSTHPIAFLGGSKLQVDYAFAHYGKLGMTHVVSFSTEF
ncbi:MAG: PorV/PorQ family protein [Elusimicrobiota bacterium]